MDYDGVSLESDNCGDRYNPDQTDSDGDGWGDECDNCSFVVNAGQEDRDVDSYGDACDTCPDDPSKIAEGTCGCGTPDLDLNGDGIPDCEGVPTFAERIISDDQLSQMADLELVDLDNDGDLDVIAALSNTDAVYGYLNQGGGQGWFRVTIAPALTVLAVDLAIADIDRSEEHKGLSATRAKRRTETPTLAVARAARGRHQARKASRRSVTSRGSSMSSGPLR